MLIRRMGPKDLEQAAAIERECFGRQAWSIQAFADALRNPAALYLCAQEEAWEPTAPDAAGRLLVPGPLCGICGLWQSFEEGEIMNVAVSPSHRRRGIAAALLGRLFEEAEKMGVLDFTLEVRESNRSAIRLYESAGFAVEGVRRNFYEEPRENALIMWKRHTEKS